MKKRTQLDFLFSRWKHFTHNYGDHCKYHGSFSLNIWSFESNFVSRITQIHTHKQMSTIDTNRINAFNVLFFCLFFRWINRWRQFVISFIIGAFIHKTEPFKWYQPSATDIDTNMYNVYTSSVYIVYQHPNSDPNWNAHFINRKKNIYFFDKKKAEKSIWQYTQHMYIDDWNEIKNDLNTK